MQKPSGPQYPEYLLLLASWAVVLSRPIDRDGQRLCVLILSVSAKYLSRALSQVYTDPQDAALIVRSDGSYIARSHLIDQVLGKAVPQDRDFLQRPQQTHGQYLITAPIDGVERYYAWHRLKHYPLIVSVGISKAKALAPVTLAQQDTWRRNAIGSVVLVLMMLIVSHLRWKAAQQATQLRVAHERMHLTLHSATTVCGHGTDKARPSSGTGDCAKCWRCLQPTTKALKADGKQTGKLLYTHRTCPACCKHGKAT